MSSLDEKDNSSAVATSINNVESQGEVHKVIWYVLSPRDSCAFTHSIVGTGRRTTMRSSLVFATSVRPDCGEVRSVRIGGVTFTDDDSSDEQLGCWWRAEPLPRQVRLNTFQISVR